MSKILIVYYSLSGNTQFIAEIIKESINADILELKPIKELKGESATTFFWGGFQAIMKKKPELEPINVNPDDYDLVILGTPVWAWRQSPPMNSFMSKYNLSGKNIALFMSADGDGGKALTRFKDALKDVNILGEICFQSPLKNDNKEAKEKAINWIRSIVDNLKN